MKVNIIIGGFQKCGTTALHSFLSNHPKVIGSKPKELNFFDSELNFKRGEDYYHSFFDRKPKLYKIRGFKFLESSPSYISFRNSEKISERIYKYNNKMKIICLVRDPINRAFSAWNMFKNRYESGNSEWWINWVLERNGKIPDQLIRRTNDEYESFELFIQNEIRAINEDRNIECPILNRGIYFHGISVYRKMFGENMIVLKNENLNEDTPKVLITISNFIGLEEFNWNKFQNQKVYEGSYSEKPDTSTVNFLTDYYREPNKMLYDLTGINYL